jgi:asparagine N-glycosylation enzyme membrane subunit Stt3
MQNLGLNGYISDDAWWHYRQVKEVVNSGHRLNPDIYEFTALNRPMTYPPLFHYSLAAVYKIFQRFMPLIRFTHYFNILEGFLYIILLYAIAYLFTSDKLFSLIGALAAAASYGMIIRARTGELMPFVLADLLSLSGLLPLLILLKDMNHPRRIGLSMAAGILFGLAMLAWSGTILVYWPLIFFAFFALIITQPQSSKIILGLFLFCSAAAISIILPWYLPLVLKYGASPHIAEMSWFMRNFTVLHQTKPFNAYLLASGAALFFIPVVFLISCFKRSASDIFIILWVVLAGIATYTGWRGYVAVVPIVSALSISIVLSRITSFFFKKETTIVTVLFILLFILTGVIGYHTSGLRLRRLDQNNPNEVRANARGIKMLEFLRDKYSKVVAIDHITWISEDTAVGGLLMVAGQYLEYLPKGSADALKDSLLAYLSDEEEAYRILSKYNADLIIVRRQILNMGQLSILFAPPELKSEDYMKITRDSLDPAQVSINFTPRGIQTILFRMLSRQELKHFELVYCDITSSDTLPFAVVYKIKKP